MVVLLYWLEQAPVLAAWHEHLASTLQICVAVTSVQYATEAGQKVRVWFRDRLDVHGTFTLDPSRKRLEN